MAQLLMTLIGEDKPGIVEKIAQIIEDHQASWANSSMCRLADKFCGLLLIDCQAEHECALVTALEALNGTGLHLRIEKGQVSKAEPPKSILTINIVGNDKPGIVREISSILATAKLNVIDLCSSVNSAAMSGVPLFEATITASTDDLHQWTRAKEHLEALASDLMIDITEPENFSNN